MEFIEQYDSESLIVLGEGGMGKTTLLFQILESFYNNSDEFFQIPLYIELNRCPTNLESWCLDDKNSVFIEKCIAELLKDEKNVDKNDYFIKEIQNEFRKEPLVGKPQYLILLDGLNEVTTRSSNGYSVRMILENEIANSLQRYKNVRFVITSRSNTDRIKGIKKIDISGVSKECILEYLIEQEKKNMKKGITDQVLCNEMLLDCLKVPLFLNMFGVVSGNTVVTTRGEILREFFYKKRASLYLNRIETNTESGFILDFIIPKIAWEMSLNDSFSISFAKIQEIINKVLTNKDESIALNELSQKCFRLYDSPSYLCNVLISKYSDEQRTKVILDIIVENLAIIYVNNGEYKFKHHYFRDYFAAQNIINEMELGVCAFLASNSEGNYLNNIKNYRLNMCITQFISESIGLHNSNPQYIPGQGWLMREWDRNNEIMLKLLDVFRGRFDCNIGYSLWNIVRIINFAGMGLLGIDMSDLNLQNINFNGVLCGIGKDLPELATVFDNSILDLNYFLPISHQEIVTNARYSDDGEYILTISSTKLIIWSLAYQYVDKLDVKNKINNAFFSKDSNYIIYCTKDSEIGVWDILKNKNFLIKNNDGEIADLCQGDSDDSIFVAYANGNIKKLNILSRRWIGRTFRVRHFIEQIVYNKKHGQIVVKTKQGDILYGNEYNSNFRKILISNIKYITQSHNGNKMGVITLDNCIGVGDLLDKQLTIIPYANKNISELVLSSDGKYLAFVVDELTIEIVNLETNSHYRPLKCTFKVTSVSFSGNNKYIISAAGDSFAKIWEVKSNVGVCIRPLGDIADWIRNAYYSSDSNCIATSSIDTSGKIWDSKTGVLVNLLYGHKDRVTSISFAHSGEKVVTTSDDCTAKIWEVKDSGCLKSLKNNDNSVHNAVFDEEDKRLVTVSWDSTGTIWNLDTKDNNPQKLIGHKAPVHTVLFDPLFDVLITSSNDNTAILWDAKTGEKTGIQVAHLERLNSAAFSPDGEYIITSSFDKTAKIWTRGGVFVKSLEGHGDSVRSALYSPDGNYIVTVSRDTTGKLWNGHTLLWHKDLIGHTYFVRSAMFDKDSKKIVTASYDGSVREWNLNGDCTNVIHSVLGLFVCGCDFRNLNSKCFITPEQKRIFLTQGALIN